MELNVFIQQRRKTILPMIPGELRLEFKGIPLFLSQSSYYVMKSLASQFQLVAGFKWSTPNTIHTTGRIVVLIGILLISLWPTLCKYIWNNYFVVLKKLIDQRDSISVKKWKKQRQRQYVSESVLYKKQLQKKSTCEKSIDSLNKYYPGLVLKLRMAGNQLFWSKLLLE